MTDSLETVYDKSFDGMSVKEDPHQTGRLSFLTPSA